MINSELRIESGLTYGARSSFEARRFPGAFDVAAFTQNEATERALEMALAVLKKLHDQGITNEQLQSAKTYIKGQFGPTLQTNGQLAETIADLEFYGLGADYINSYFDRIDQMTMADARRVITQYFPSDNLAIVLIGKAPVIEAAGKKLASDVTKKSITDAGF
jgi:zinc protease